MEQLFKPEVVAGGFLAVYFIVRGFHTLFSRIAGNGSSNRTITNADLAADHVRAELAAKHESIISRQEFIDHQRVLEDIRTRVEAWDDMIRHGDFTCKWREEDVTLTIDRLRRIENMLESMKQR